MCCSLKKCVKCLLIAINILILLCGAAALGTGIWVIVDQDSFFNITMATVDKEFLRYSAIVLATGGAATIFFAVLGIAAAATTSSCLLGLYIAVISLVIALEVAAVILGIVFKDAWEQGLDREMIESIETKYDGNSATDFTGAMDKFQKDHKCCGWINGSDYILTGSQWDRTYADGSVAVVPLSCCQMMNASQPMANCSTVPIGNNSFIQQGCKSTLNLVFTRYQGVIIGFSGGIAGLEFFLLILAVILIVNKRPNKYDMS